MSTSTLRTRLRRASAVCAAAVVALTALPSVADAATQPTSTCTYVPSSLPLPAGSTFGFPVRGNGSTLLAGGGRDAAGLMRPLLWRRGKVSVLASPGGVGATGLDVNSDGVVLAVTYGEADSFVPRPFIVRGGRAVPLAVPAGADVTAGYSINDDGLVIGYSFFGGTMHGMAWSVSRPGAYVDLGVGEGWLLLSGLTETGVFVGFTQGSDGTLRAVRGTLKGGITRLPGTDPSQSSQATGAADAFVVGAGVVLGGTERTSLLWNRGVPAALPSGLRVEVVSAAGQVAGRDASLVRDAVTWKNGVTSVLPAPADAVDFGTSVSEVNNDGTVFGDYVTQADNTLPVRWTCS